MEVLVTGAGGYVAGAVVDRLVAAGHRVTALVHRAGAGRSGGDVEVVAADLRDPGQLAAVGLDRGFDGVCHLAALTRVRESRLDPLAYWAVNVEGTRGLLAALAAGAERTGRRPVVVLASTCAVYGLVDGPAAESRPAAPTSPYAATKLAAEVLLGAVAETGAVGAVSLRSFNVAGAVGARGDTDLGRLVPKAVAVAAGRVPAIAVNGDGSAAREYLHLADAADAYVLALSAARPGTHSVYNIGSGRGTTVNEIISTVQEVTGRPVARESRPAAAEPAMLVADSRRIRDELGWTSPRSDIGRIVADAWAWELRRN